MRDAERERPRELRVEQGPTRCPFCHEGVAVESEAWVACEKCLARHHRACWDEGKRCASCGASAPLKRLDVVDTSRLLTCAFAEAGWSVRSVVPRTGLPPHRWLGLDLERDLSFEVAPSARGVFSALVVGSAIPATLVAEMVFFASVEIASGDGRTTLRLRHGLRRQVAGVIGVIGFFMSFGLGWASYLSGDPIGNVLAAAGGFVLAIIFALTVYRLVERAGQRNAEKILDAIERALADAHGIIPQRPRPPSPKDAV
jgi:hypothetical protein